jgi:myo-inositol-1(or 4)-monophosphatase
MGRLDGFWELDLGPWDMAAGVLIVREAGGRVTHVNGGRFSPYEHGILASNGHLHAEMLTALTMD